MQRKVVFKTFFSLLIDFLFEYEFSSSSKVVFLKFLESNVLATNVLECCVFYKGKGECEMFFYQVQKHNQRIFVNGYVEDENYLCSLTMNASIVFALVQPIYDLQKRMAIGLSRTEMELLLKRLEECKQNHSYYRLITHPYKTLVRQDDFDMGLVELLAVCHFLIDGDSFYEANKIWFVETSFKEWRE